ncbi:hypothetical protein HMPREF3193_00306 [Bifidobacterium breve]|nr:hypothetical protein HMPREF1587_01292 [Bifidobacterium breve JCP7499]KWZ86600.1 hypothetical protein HMPREF3193_00306 [Bifidobacterium breve]
MQCQIVCRNYQQCAVRNKFRRVPSPNPSLLVQKTSMGVSLFYFKYLRFLELSI